MGKTYTDLFAYQPSMAGAAIFILLYGLSSGVHIWILVRQRTWYFIPFAIGCLFETVGYIGRAQLSNQVPNFELNSYIMQTLLLLLGPTLFAASIYMVLGRVVVLLGADAYSLIKPKWLTAFFVFGDVMSFFLQGAGGGILSKADTPSDIQTGNDIIIAGLVLQILFFGFFIAVAAVFHARMRQMPTQKSRSVAVPWEFLLVVMYSAGVLIMIRSVYRVIEYSLGRDSSVQTHEFWLYIFDSVPMVCTALLFNWFHPSRVVNAKTIGQGKADSSYNMDEGAGQREWARV